MARKHKKVLPLTVRHPPEAPSSSSVSFSSPSGKPPTKVKSTQRLISHYHTLNKRLSLHLAQNDTVSAAAVRAEMDSLGGLHAYQKASLKGGNEKQGKGACGTWVVKFLKREKDTLLDGGEGKLRLLDVGAVSGTTYVRQSSWIDTTSIDLNPQHPRVIKQDFFDRPVPRTEAERFHVVCLSLVVNFVGDVWQRGQMLLHARNHLLPNGLLFLALPLPCITNSRYMTHDRMLAILKSIGFEPLEQHFAKKLAFYLVRKVEAPPVRRWKKEEVNPGPGRNNFCIVLGGGRGGAGGGGT